MIHVTLVNLVLFLGLTLSLLGNIVHYNKPNYKQYKQYYKDLLASQDTIVLQNTRCLNMVDSYTGRLETIRDKCWGSDGMQELSNRLKGRYPDNDEKDLATWIMRQCVEMRTEKK